jgi:tryptophan synthase alpha chain
VTGARDELPPETREVVQRAAVACRGVVPFAVGFGVSKPEHVRAMFDAGAPGVVVGSAIVGRIEKGETPDAVRAFVGGLK